MNISDYVAKYGEKLCVLWLKVGCKKYEARRAKKSPRLSNGLGLPSTNSLGKMQDGGITGKFIVDRTCLRKLNSYISHLSISDLRKIEALARKILSES